MVKHRSKESALVGRRAFLTGSVAAASAAGVALVAAAPADAATAANTTIEPAFGAGVFDVDLNQSGVSQSPNVKVSSSVSALPLDLAF